MQDVKADSQMSEGIILDIMASEDERLLYDRKAAASPKDDGEPSLEELLAD